MNTLLKVQNLKTFFYTIDGTIPAVNDVSFEVNEQETLGLIGESGSGKSITALSIMQLVPLPGRIIEGSILFKGENVLEKDQREMRKIRGNKIAMIFQDPMTSLNPLYTVGNQIAESITTHLRYSKKEALNYAIEMLKLVGIPSPERRINEFPHQLSGGMRQRVMIAMALCCQPSLLIADEPTTALDVTVQAQILELIADMKQKMRMSVLIITHDLGVIAEVADRVVVMYAGSVMEKATVLQIFSEPLHPYTRGLIDSIPRIDVKVDRLKSIEGTLPSLSNTLSGCKFKDRCTFAYDICDIQEPPILKVGNREVRCFRYT